MAFGSHRGYEACDEVTRSHGIFQRGHVHAIDGVDAEGERDASRDGPACVRVFDTPSVIADLEDDNRVALDSREALALQHLGDRDLERSHNVEGDELLRSNVQLHDCLDHLPDERNIRLEVLRAQNRVQRHRTRVGESDGDAEAVSLSRHRGLHRHARLVVAPSLRNVGGLKLREADRDVRVLLEARAHRAPLQALDDHPVADKLPNNLAGRVFDHFVLLALVLEPAHVAARVAAHGVRVGAPRCLVVAGGVRISVVVGGGVPRKAEALRRGREHRYECVHLVLVAVAGSQQRSDVRNRGPHRAFDHLAGSDVLPGGGLGDFRDVNLFFDCGAVLSVGSVGAVLAARARERLEHLKHRLSHAEGFIDVGAPQDGVDCVIHEQLDRAPREEDTPLVARGHLTQLPLARHHGAGRPHSRPPIEDVAPLIVFDRAFLVVFAGPLRDGGDVVVRRVEAPLPPGALPLSLGARNHSALLGRALGRRELFPDAGVVPDPFSLRVRTRLPVRATPLGAVDPGHTALGLRHALPQLVRPVVASPASLADLLVGAAPVVVQVALEKAAHGAVIPRAVLEALGGAGGLVEVATRIHLALSVRRAGARGVLGVADAR
mmetsp:Transcript_9682/g.23596  ORF Transcript_9682/g.23596 Transcript_9682/m.23596 type:complete len:606 (+) Transcript_9682:587-2404(+)